jgi:hypothetical protein
LSEEYGDAIPSTFEPIFAMKTLKCSDIVLYGEKTHMVVHNEDSSFSDVNHTALVIAKIGHTPRFVGYTYLGDLPTGAIGYNDHGIGFTLNCTLYILIH